MSKSLWGRVEQHERMHAYYSCESVKQHQRGNAWRAEWNMEQAAMERHLAYEMRETWRIASDASSEYLRGFLAARGRV